MTQETFPDDSEPLTKAHGRHYARVLKTTQMNGMKIKESRRTLLDPK
jgi:hypothetical protein